jgi:hypothetical protein
LVSVWEKSVVDLVSLGGKITLLLNKKSIRPVRQA